MPGRAAIAAMTASVSGLRLADLVVDARLEIDVVGVEHRHVPPLAERRPQRLLDRVDDRAAVDAAGVLAFGDELLGNRRHAVIGAEPHDPLILADDRVELIEERADRLVQVRVHVLDLVAARAEGVADEVGAREADREHVGALMFAELQRLHERRGEASEVRVGKRAALPLREVRRVGLVGGAFQHMREAARPSLRRRFADAFVRAGVRRPRAGCGPTSCRSPRPAGSRRRTLSPPARRPSAYADEVSQPSSVLVSQVTASPPWPPSMIALRSLSDSDTTCACRCERI